jgi:hypothetical protein
MIEKEFVPYKQALALKELGFDEPCFAFFQVEYTELLPTMVDDDEEYRLTGYRTCSNLEIPKHYTSAPTFSQAFRWFRDNHDLHVQIRKENYFHESKYEYFHFDISKGEENDITQQSVLLDSILDECTQDIPGNHLNNEKYSKLIFEKRFAFKTYEEIELECLNKLIKIVNEQQ